MGRMVGGSLAPIDHLEVTIRAALYSPVLLEAIAAVGTRAQAQVT
jgi:hypothetical protein